MQQKKKNNQGFSAIGMVVFFIVLGIVATAVYIRGFSADKDSLASSAIYNHMKQVVNAAENQKRQLGAYPTSLKAMIDKDKFLTSKGNSKHIVDENSLRTAWNGPYIKGFKVLQDKTYLPDDYYYFRLDDISHKYTGRLHRSLEDPTKLVYTIATDEVASKDHITKVARKVLEKCNGDKDIILAYSTRYYTVYGNNYKPCGYIHYTGKITEFNYFIADIGQ